MILLAIIAGQYAGALTRHLGFLGRLYPVTLTQMEMSSYRAQLQLYLDGHDNRWPDDLSAWLRASFMAIGDKDPAVDRFGTPYVADDDFGRPVLRSCGPDRACPTDDDLVLIFAAREPPWYVGLE